MDMGVGGNWERDAQHLRGLADTLDASEEPMCPHSSAKRRDCLACLETASRAAAGRATDTRLTIVARPLTGSSYDNVQQVERSFRVDGSEWRRALGWLTKHRLAVVRSFTEGD
jgi:hypothetical protein